MPLSQFLSCVNSYISLLKTFLKIDSKNVLNKFSFNLAMNSTGQFFFSGRNQDIDTASFECSSMLHLNHTCITSHLLGESTTTFHVQVPVLSKSPVAHSEHIDQKCHQLYQFYDAYFFHTLLSIMYLKIQQDASQNFWCVMVTQKLYLLSYQHIKYWCIL